MIPKFFLHSLLILLMIQSSSSDEDDIESSSSCNTPFRCGNISIGYPFWGAPQPQSCGAHPELYLTCSGDDDQQLPAIDIKGVSYFVKNINPTTKTVRISRTDYETGICSPQYPNTTINLEVFNYYEEYHNVTFLYDCPTQYKVVPVTFQCLNGNYKTWSVLAGVHGPGPCSASVVIPFPKKLNWTSMTDPSDLVQVLREGFKLIWIVGGNCGGFACPPTSTAPNRPPSPVLHDEVAPILPPTSGT